MWRHLWPLARNPDDSDVHGRGVGCDIATDDGGTRRSTGAPWLVAAEVALSTVLVVVAAPLGVSFLGVLNVERGFDVDPVLTADINLPSARYPKSEQREQLHHRMLDVLNTLPGVTSAALVSSLPLKAQRWGTMISKEGDTRPLLERPLAHFRFVSPRYFEAMGIDVRAGRVMSETDRGRPVAVVSESAAAKAWPGESPVGRRLQADRGNPTEPAWVDVIGVVADIHTVRLEEAPPPMVYVPYGTACCTRAMCGETRPTSFALRTILTHWLARSGERFASLTHSFRWPTCGRWEMSREHPSRDDDSTHWWQASSLCQHCSRLPWP